MCTNTDEPEAKEFAETVADDAPIPFKNQFIT
jgi:hypothetical protein